MTSHASDTSRRLLVLLWVGKHIVRSIVLDADEGTIKHADFGFVIKLATSKRTEEHGRAITSR